MNRLIVSILLTITIVFGAFIWLIGPGHDLFGKNNTIYSSGFTESKFNAVKVGMTQNEVINIIGPPMILTVHKEGQHAKHQEFETEFTSDDITQQNILKIVYHYSKPKKIADYELTHIAFNKGIKVTGKAKWVTD